MKFFKILHVRYVSEVRRVEESQFTGERHEAFASSNIQDTDTVFLNVINHYNI